MSFSVTVQSGDLIVVPTGNSSANRLVVGDIAGATVTDPDLSDLSGVTIQYHWLVGGGSNALTPHLSITSLMWGLDIALSITFEHIDGNVTEHEHALIDFGLVQHSSSPIPATLVDDAGRVGDVSDSPLASTSNIVGNVLSNDFASHSLAVSGIDGNAIAPSGQATVGGAYGTLTMHGDGQYSFNVDQKAVDALDAGFHTTLDYSLSVTDGQGGGGIEHLSIQVTGANDAPTATAPTSLQVTAHSGANTVVGTLALHDVDSGDVPVVAGISDSMSAVSSTFNGQFGELHITAGGDFTYTADLSNSVLAGLTQSQSTVEHIHYTVGDGSAYFYGTFDILIHGAAGEVPTFSSQTLNDDSASIADLTSYSTFSVSNLAGNLLSNDTSTSPLQVTSVHFGNVTQTVSGTYTTIGGSYGTLVMHADGNYTFDYNPTAINALTADFHTTLDFAIGVSNGHKSGDIEHLTIQVSGANDIPVDHSATLSADIYASWAYSGEGSPTSTYTSGYLGSPSGYFDPEGHGLHFSLSGQTMPETGYITKTDAYGTFWLYQSGSWSFTIDGSNAAVIALGQSETAQLTFEVGISDGDGGSTLADVVVTVHGMNDGPHAVSDSITAPSVSGSFHLTGNLLSNDTDPDTNDHLSVVGVYGSSTGPTKFAVEVTGPSPSTSPVGTLHNNYGTLTVWADGHYTLNIDPHDPDYIALAPGQTVDLHFSYTISDGHSATSFAGIDVIVTGIDDPAFGYDSTVNFVEDGGSVLRLGTVSFTNPESGTAHIVGIAAPTASGGYHWDTKSKNVLGHHWYTVTNDFGKLHLSATSGYYSFTLDNASTAVQSLAAGETHIEHFEYKVSDGLGQSDIANVNVVIHGVDDAPHAHDDVYFAFEAGNTPSGAVLTNSAGSVSSNVLLNDTDIDQGTSLHVTSVNRQPPGTVFTTAYGTASLSASGEFHYHLNQLAADHLGAGQSVTVDFKYKIADTASPSAIAGADVSVVIIGENDAPTLYGNITDTSLVEDSITGASGTYHFSDVDSGDTPHVHSINGLTGTSTTGSSQDLHTWINVLGSYGTLHMSVDGHFSYDLNAGAQALAQSELAFDSFHFTISDGHGGFASTSLTFDITGANDAPVAADITLPIGQSASYTSTNLLAHVSDVDHSANVVIAGYDAGALSTWIPDAYGSVRLLDNGQLTFDVNASAVANLGSGDHVTVDFHYTALDSWSASDTGTISIVINGVNDAPTVSNDVASLTEDAGSVGGNVLSNDSDPDLGDVVIVAGITATDHKLHLGGNYGTVTISKSGDFHYHLTAPSANNLAAGSHLYETFHFSVTDQHGGLASETLSVTVTGENDRPAAGALTLQAHDAGTVSGVTYSATSFTLDLLSAATDPDNGDSPHVVGIAATTDGYFSTTISTSFGSATVDGSGILHFHLDQSAVDHLAAGVTDQIVIGYKVADLSGSTDISTVTVIVTGANDAPTAQHASASIMAGNTSAAMGTLNYGDPDNGDSVHVGSVNGATFSSGSWVTLTTSYGDLHVSRSGAYSFTVDNASTALQRLAAGEVQHEYFTYHVSDLAGLTATATIDIAITGINDAPVATSHFLAAQESGSSVTGVDATGNLLVGASDIDGDAMHVVGLYDGKGYLPTITVPYGTASVNASGSFDFHPDQGVINSLPAGSNIDFQVDFKISDGNGGTAIDTVFITIHGANDAPMAASVTANMTEDTPVLAGTLLAGATDPDNDPPSVAFVDGFAPGAHISGSHGWLSFTQWGDYSYHLDVSSVQSLTALQSTFDTFTFTISDGHGGTDMAQLHITIDGQNDNPVAGMDAASVTEAVNTTTASTVTGNVLSNDSVVGVSQSLMAVSVDGIALSGSVTATGAYGELHLFVDGDYTYSLDNANPTVDALNVGDVLYDTFHYKASDGFGHFATADLVVTINGADDAPTASMKLDGTASESGVSHSGMGATGNLMSVISDVDNTSAQLAVTSVASSSLSGTSITVAGKYGQLHVTGHGHYSYDVSNANVTVDALQSGSSLFDCFEYRVQDTQGAWVTNTLDVMVQGHNDAPVVSDLHVSAYESGSMCSGASASGWLLTYSNAFDPEGDYLSVAGVNGATNNVSTDVAGAYGSLSITVDGGFHYYVNQTAADSLAQSVTATDSFSVKVTDGHGGYDLADIVVTINGANDAPTGGNYPVTVTEQGVVAHTGTVHGTALGNDHDVDLGDVIVAVSLDGLSALTETGDFGKLTLTTQGHFTFHLDENNLTVESLNSGTTITDTFHYKLSDGHGGTAIASITVNIKGANDAATFSGSLTGNVVEAGGVADSLSNTATASGSVAVYDVDNSGYLLSTSGTANFGQFHVFDYGWTYTLDNSNVTVEALNTGDTVTDSFSITAVDGTTQKVSVVIHGANDAAVIGGAATGSVTEAGGVANGTLGVAAASGLATDTDVDNTPNTFQVVAAGAASDFGYGTWGINAAGAWTYTLDDSNAAVQALNSSSTPLTDSFTIHTEDGTAQLVTVTINGANDAATIGGTTSGSVIEAGGVNNGNAGTPTATGTLTAADVDNTADTFQAVASATPGVNGYGTFTVTSGGQWSYTLDNSNTAVDALALGSTLTDSFTVNSVDGTAQVVTITIHGANDNPVAHSETAAAVESGVSPGTSPVGNLLANDTDVDTAHLLSVANVELLAPTVDVSGDYGVLHVTSSGHFTYMLDNSSPLVDSLAVGDMVTETFQYTVSDEHGATSTAELVVYVSGANDAPVGHADAGSANEAGIAGGSAATGNVLSNDTDVDAGHTLHATAETVTGAYGTLVVASNGQYTYTVDDANASVNALAAGETLAETLSYTVVDDQGATGVGSLVLTIHGANDAPTAADDTGTAGEEGSTTAGFNATGNVLSNDSDADHLTSLAIALVNSSDAGSAVDGLYGQLTLNSDGSYTYIVDDSSPTVDALGPSGTLHDIFTYTVSDGQGGTSTAQLDITIDGANDEPSGGVTINGSPLPGNTLTVTNTLSDPEGVGTLQYQWQADGFDISGANGSSFLMTQAQAGAVIGVVVSYVDGGGTTESVTATSSIVEGQDILGTRSNDSLVGGAGDDTIDGDRGRDTMVGGAGNDLYYVDDSRDVVVENTNGGDDTVISTASYVLSANVENLYLSGHASSAKGNGLDNIITGDGSSNDITGLGGADTLTGGLGSDTFIFTSLGDSSTDAYDTITDFNAAQRDKIDLRMIDARDTVPGNQSFKFIGTADFVEGANNAGLLRFDPVTHMLEGSTNADANPEFCILLVGVDHIGRDAGGISSANILL